jgi:CRISPR system Cascade subunit CasA
MDSAEFNLLHEPWIVVMTLRGEVKEVSLLEVFEHAHQYRSLAGELPTQDVAVLRLLLAVLYATFMRVDTTGNIAAVTTGDEALDRWGQLWNIAQFPLEPISASLKPYEDRFYLFHPERPFYQVAGLTQGTEYQAAKLLGDLSESNNKVRLFPTRTGRAKKHLTNAEAARWLLYLNGYDDTSAKPSTRGAGLPSSGAGWLGRLGLVYVEGDTLFETLLLNFVLLDDNDKPFDFSKAKATWELDEVRRSERVEITTPKNPLELLTLQSRRVLLQREQGLVSGYLLLGGDFFNRENAFIEQMTTWRQDTHGKSDFFLPKRHNESRQAWREFASLLANDGKSQHRPGVVSWVATLQLEEFIETRPFYLRVTGIQYADKDFYVDGIISDGLTMSSALLSTLGNGWITEIADLLNTTEKCVWQLGILAHDIAKSEGNRDEKNMRAIRSAAQERAYFALDIPFRRWLAGIDPNMNEHSEKRFEWLELTRQIIMGIADRLIEEAAEKAIVGMYERDETSPKNVNVFSAYQRFRNWIYRLCKVTERRTNEPDEQKG